MYGSHLPLVTVGLLGEWGLASMAWWICCLCDGYGRDLPCFVLAFVAAVFWCVVSLFWILVDLRMEVSKWHVWLCVFVRYRVYGLEAACQSLSFARGLHE